MNDSPKFSRSLIECFCECPQRYDQSDDEKVSASNHIRSGGPAAAPEKLRERTHVSGDIQLKFSEGDRGGQLSLNEDLEQWDPKSGTKPSLMPRAKKRANKIGVNHCRPCTNREKGRAESLPHHSTHNQRAPTCDVGNGTSRQREEEEWRGGSGCDEGERERRGA